MPNLSTSIPARWKSLRRELLAHAVLVSVITPLSLLAFAVTGPLTGRAVIYSDSMDGKAVAMKVSITTRAG